MDVSKFGQDVWGLILRFNDVVTVIYLASTCRWLRQRFRNHDRVTKWQNWWHAAKFAPLPSSTTYNTGLVAAATLGDLSLVKVFLKKSTWRCWALSQASRYNHLDVVAFLSDKMTDEYHPYIDSRNSSAWIECGASLRSETEQMKTQQNRSETFEQCIKLKITLRHDFFYMAFAHGDMEALSRWSELSPSWILVPLAVGAKMFRFAGRFGHLNVLRWGMTFPSARFYVYCGIRAGIAAEHLHILEFSSETNVWKFSSEICHWGSVTGNLDMLEFARKHKMIVPHYRSMICANAVIHGCINVLKWALEHKYLRSLSRLKRVARRHPQLGVTAWLLEVAKKKKT